MLNVFDSWFMPVWEWIYWHTQNRFSWRLNVLIDDGVWSVREIIKGRTDNDCHK